MLIKALKTLFVVLAVLLILFIAVEIFYRIIWLSTSKEKFNLRTINHIFAGPIWRPGLDIVVPVDISGEKIDIRFQVNEFGFVSNSMRTARKPENTRRIFFIGGSTTECGYLPAEERFPYLVEKKLAEAIPDSRFEIASAAMGGYQTINILSVIINKIMFYQPDTIIIMEAINDMVHGFILDYNEYDPVSLFVENRDSGRLNIWGRIAEKSYLLQKIREFIGYRLKRFDKNDITERKKIRKKQPMVEIKTYRSLSTFKRHIKEIGFICKANNVEVIFLTQPSLYQENTPKEIDNVFWLGTFGGGNASNSSMYKGMQLFNQAIIDTCKDYGFQYIDLDKKINKTLENMLDDVHYTKTGSKNVADAISEYIISAWRKNAK